MEEQLKREILQNNFFLRLRVEGATDHREYRSLCNALVDLEREWRDRQQIDKDVAGFLYNIYIVMFSLSQVTELESGPANSDALQEMALELSALIERCFYGVGAPT